MGERKPNYIKLSPPNKTSRAGKGYIRVVGQNSPMETSKRPRLILRLCSPQISDWAPLLKREPK